MRVIGIDIGRQGAVALLYSSGALLDVEDMPILRDGPNNRPSVNGALLAPIIRRWAPEQAFVDRPDEFGQREQQRRNNKRGDGPKIKEGLVLAIEPMINLGTKNIKHLNDGWTIITADGKPSAHFEHDVAVVDGKPEILSTYA